VAITFLLKLVAAKTRVRLNFISRSLKRSENDRPRLENNRQLEDTGHRLVELVERDRTRAFFVEPAPLQISQFFVLVTLFVRETSLEVIPHLGIVLLLTHLFI
jgi:hypothetical protein